MLRWERFAAAYLGMSIIACVIAVVWAKGLPYAFDDPWLALPPHASHTYSALVGLAFGALVVVLTKPMVAKLSWARNLHNDLRPLARGISTTGIVVLAALSALGEELLFRGLLHPWLGLVPQALVFGLVHQLPGKSRWVWVVWATLMGLALGAIFQLTGSLLGPILAHAVINGCNLHYLKTHNPSSRPRQLGGLLGERG